MVFWYQRKSIETFFYDWMSPLNQVKRNLRSPIDHFSLWYFVLSLNIAFASKLQTNLFAAIFPHQGHHLGYTPIILMNHFYLWLFVNLLLSTVFPLSGLMGGLCCQISWWIDLTALLGILSLHRLDNCSFLKVDFVKKNWVSPEFWRVSKGGWGHDFYGVPLS